MANELENVNEANEGLEFITEKQKAEIQAKVKELRETKNIKRIYPISVEGDEFDEKPLYVAYFKQPSLMEFSKYMTVSAKNDPTIALRQLAKDCFIDGDKELVDDDSLFIYGAMSNITSILNTRKSSLVNFSKSGK